jgi:zinc/manganese transport system substrate-binding protein
LADARLVFINGLGFEGWIERLVKSSGYRGPVVVASKGAKLLRLSAAHRHGDRHDHAHDAADPHAWLDPANALIYVSNIERALTQVDPAGAAHYRESAAQLSGEIRALDGQIRAMLEPVPAARRMVVSSHESFAYFGRAYGIRFRAPLGLSTEAGAAAADVGALIRQIRREKIPAIFLEKITDPRLLEQVRRETGAVIGGMLYSDALSEPGGNAPDYLAMMRHNAQALATALTR